MSEPSNPDFGDGTTRYADDGVVIVPINLEVRSVSGRET